MASEEKPYRVYRGGRQKGKVPTLPPLRTPRPSEDGRGGEPPAPAAPKRRRRFGWGARIAIGLLLLLVLLLVWGLTSWLAVRRGVERANERLDAGTRAVLDRQEGLLVSTPTTILLVGTDHAPGIEDRRTARRSDSLLLVRTDPRRNRIAYLSIPRDLLVEIPGYGRNRVNAAFQLGGAALAVRTVRRFTGVPINHIAIVDFASFGDVIDALGGVTVDVPKPIISNRFDCPYATQEQCRRWEGWRFKKGEQEMDGTRALIYSRVRENKLDPSDTDISRGERQQAVLNAITGKATSFTSLLKLPLLGDDLLAPLATDLSAWQLTQLGWRKFRSDGGRDLHCRLGGEPLGGELAPSEDNRETLAMFLGISAPQPPVGLFGPGCLVGS